MSTKIRVLDYASQATVLAATTNVDGTTFTAFADVPCQVVDFANFSGTTVEYRRRGGGTAFPVANGATRRILGIKNANEVSVRRTDLSVTPVTVFADALVD